MKRLYTLLVFLAVANSHAGEPCRLSNGNTVVSNVLHGKHSDPNAPSVYEVTPEKEVVWKVYSPEGNMGNIQVLDDGGECLK